MHQHRFLPTRKSLLGRSIIAVIAGLLISGIVTTASASANHNADQHRKMDVLFTSPNSKINSDLAFWGNHAFVGYYTGDAQPSGGVRIFDISDPSGPQLVRDFQCDGLQNDPIVWDRNGNGVADLLMLAVDRTMAAPECGAPRTAHNDPNGWEGVRVFTMSDDPANPFTNIQQVKGVYTDCGAHTITLWPDEADKLLAYVSSYPLRPGPTCGTIAPAGGPAPWQNTANPYDEEPGSPANPLHGVIQVVEVPLADPSAAEEASVQPEISYPGDPDGKIDWTERGLSAPGVLEPAAVACHDIVVDVSSKLAAGACAEQGQVWNIDENGIPDTANPVSISDDQLTSGGTGDIPGAIDFFHSSMFNNDTTVVNWVDESFGDGCPPTTTYQSRPWNPAGGTHDTGRAFFTDAATGSFLSDFQVGNLRPEEGAYCSAHMGMVVPGASRDLLVNAWYMGGVDVINFSDPTKPKEIAYYDIAPAGPTGSDNWSAYPYVGPKFKTGPGIPVYASDGVHNPPSARGLVVFRTNIGKTGGTVLDHLNPQTLN